MSNGSHSAHNRLISTNQYISGEYILLLKYCQDEDLFQLKVHVCVQRNESKLSDHIRTLKQEKQALEVDLQLMKKERDLAKAQVTSTSGTTRSRTVLSKISRLIYCTCRSECVFIVHVSGDKTFEMRLLEDKHKEEVSALRKKLQWFAENQELLDKDAGRLKAATAEIHRLKEQVRLCSHSLFTLA